MAGAGYPEPKQTRRKEGEQAKTQYPKRPERQRQYNARKKKRIQDLKGKAAVKATQVAVGYLLGYRPTESRHKIVTSWISPASGGDPPWLFR